jgi:hypothetical protein
MGNFFHIGVVPPGKQMRRFSQPEFVQVSAERRARLILE